MITLSESYIQIYEMRLNEPDIKMEKWINNKF